jgi:hypothetical protein
VEAIEKLKVLDTRADAIVTGGDNPFSVRIRRKALGQAKIFEEGICGGMFPRNP